MSELKPYTVTDVLRHNGDVYESGSQVHLTDKQADALLKLNVVKHDIDAQFSESLLIPTGEEKAKQSGGSDDKSPPEGEQDEGSSKQQLTVAQIKAILDEKGIVYDKTALKPDLLALLPVQE